MSFLLQLTGYEKRTVLHPITNVGFKSSAEELRQRLKPTALIVDSIQKDNCTIADAVEVWETLKTDGRSRGKEKISEAIQPLPGFISSHFRDAGS